MKRTRIEVATIIERFVDGRSSPYEWDDFISRPVEDSVIDEIRLECVAIPERFPPSVPTQYCNEQGAERLKGLAARLRSTA